MEITKAFGANLRRYIKKSKFNTYQSFADELDISISFLNQLMRSERKPSLEMLMKISQLLDISVSDLLDEKKKGRSLSEMTQQELIDMINSMVITIEGLIDRKSRQASEQLKDALEREALKKADTFTADPKRLELLGLINRAPPELVDTLVNTVRGFLESSSDDLKPGNVNNS